jgi:hypothetical protein
MISFPQRPERSIENRPVPLNPFSRIGIPAAAHHSPCSTGHPDPVVYTDQNPGNSDPTLPEQPFPGE